MTENAMPARGAGDTSNELAKRDAVAAVEKLLPLSAINGPKSRDAAFAKRHDEASKIVDTVLAATRLTAAVTDGVTQKFKDDSQRAAIRALRGLEQTAIMLEKYAPEVFPEVNEQGQTHFGRAMMEAAAQAIRDAWSDAVKEAAPPAQTAQVETFPDVRHPSHVTRDSDASSFDEICINCGGTDEAGNGWGDLARPCPKVSAAPAQAQGVETRMQEHVIYKTGDADAPSQIKDRNGEVVLQECKVCGLAEGELVSQFCSGKHFDTPTTPASEGEMLIERIIIRAEEALRLREKVLALSANGEDDPKTDDYKLYAMAYGIADDDYREITSPQTIIPLMRRLAAPAARAGMTEEWAADNRREELKRAFVSGCCAVLTLTGSMMPQDDLDEAGYDYASRLRNAGT